jgi:hypothetical protein
MFLDGLNYGDWFVVYRQSNPEFYQVERRDSLESVLRRITEEEQWKKKISLKLRCINSLMRLQ